jgi:undecaprenyl-diphosphatase
MSILQAILLGIIEGITEFLPISSTGHMIIASSVMGIAEDSFTKAFTIAIQLGAILSVVVLYRKRFFKGINFYAKLAVAFLPAGIIGFLCNKLIDSLLSNVLVVASSMLLGGIILLFVDGWFHYSEEDGEGKEVGMKNAFIIGLFQVISMVPGVSRSAATIVGGLSQGFNRKTAAEFSFFLAVPTMFIATCFKLYKFYKVGGGFTHHDITLLIIGNVVAFIVALVAVRVFIGFLTKHGFKLFGYYRIGLGLLIFMMYFIGFKILMV